jgi:hypothetical protein
MADRPDLRQDEEAYWQASKAFVRLLIAELNTALVEQKISKPKRKEICESYVFSLANVFDQQWFKANGQTTYPLLCFTNTFLNIDTALSDLPAIDVPHKAVELHAMVSDEVEWFFQEMKEDETAVVVGNVGEETPDVAPPPPPAVERYVSKCNMCQGSGECFCIRKGPGNAVGCLRCKGTGQCQHCHGTGNTIHR